jgi:hypothetical protein
MTAARAWPCFCASAARLTARFRAAPRRRRFETPGKPLGSIPLIRFCPG